MPAPPSTFRFTLVIIEAPSDARNKNALAMSSGIWRRPSGVASSLRRRHAVGSAGYQGGLVI